MSRDLNQTERATLEWLIDTCSLQAVLEALSEICEEKADHIQASYATSNATEPTARLWRECCGVIGLAVCEKPIGAVSR